MKKKTKRKKKKKKKEIEENTCFFDLFNAQPGYADPIFVLQLSNDHVFHHTSGSGDLSIITRFKLPYKRQHMASGGEGPVRLFVIDNSASDLLEVT